MIAKTDFRLIAAPFTPFDNNGELNLGVIPAYVDYLTQNKVHGVFICGTTGESVSMSIDERKRVAEAWSAAAKGRLKVIVHIGGNSVVECQQLAEHAGKLDVAAVAIFAPFFFKPSSAAELVAFMKPIAQKASKLPFYYYHMPSMTGITVSASDISALAMAQIENFKGVKFTHFDMYDMQKCISLSPDIEIMHGYDETLLCGLTLGVQSAVGSTYNYIPSVYKNVIGAFQSGDLAKARKHQLESVELVKILVRYGGGVRAGKAIMKIAGIDCGSCRVPLSSFSESEFNQLKKDVESLNLIDYAK